MPVWCSRLSAAARVCALLDRTSAGQLEPGRSSAGPGQAPAPSRPRARASAAVALSTLAERAARKPLDPIQGHRPQGAAGDDRRGRGTSRSRAISPEPSPGPDGPQWSTLHRGARLTLGDDVKEAAFVGLGGSPPHSSKQASWRRVARYSSATSGSGCVIGSSRSTDFSQLGSGRRRSRRAVACHPAAAAATRNRPAPRTPVHAGRRQRSRGEGRARVRCRPNTRFPARRARDRWRPAGARAAAR